MRALVIANGEPPSLSLLAAVGHGADLIVAADGGARHALDAGLDVAAVVGDLDSITDDARARLPADRLLHAPDLDKTDLQKAIRFAIERGCERVDVAAAGGGRADHALANLSLPVLFRGQAEVHILDDLFDVRLVDGEAIVEAPAGTVVSLIAVSPCAGLTTRGLRWDLTDYSLRFSPLGVHNEVASSPARVRVVSGDLLLFEGRWVEKHR